MQAKTHHQGFLHQNPDHRLDTTLKPEDVWLEAPDVCRLGVLLTRWKRERSVETLNPL